LVPRSETIGELMVADIPYFQVCAALLPRRNTSGLATLG